jgi:hypothetical protein
MQEFTNNNYVNIKYFIDELIYEGFDDIDIIVIAGERFDRESVIQVLNDMRQKGEF